MPPEEPVEAEPETDASSGLEAAPTEVDEAMPPTDGLAMPAPEPQPADMDAPAQHAASDAAASAPTTDAASPAPGEALAELPPAQLPAAIDLRYVVEGHAKGFNYHARSSMSLRHDGQRYEAKASVSAFLVGRREQRSEGRIDAQGLHPETFIDHSRRERRATLDTASQRLRFHHGGDAPLQAGTQDRLSVALQLSALFLARPDAWPPGSTIRLPVTDVSNLELWDFVVDGPDELEVDGQRLPTIRLSRQPRRERDRKVQIWLTPALDFLPARIRISEANGDFVDQLIDMPLPVPAVQAPSQ